MYKHLVLTPVQNYCSLYEDVNMYILCMRCFSVIWCRVRVR